MKFYILKIIKEIKLQFKLLNVSFSCNNKTKRHLIENHNGYIEQH